MRLRWIIAALVGGLGIAWHEASPITGYMSVLGFMVLLALKQIGEIESKDPEHSAELDRDLSVFSAPLPQKSPSAPASARVSDIFNRDPNWINRNKSQPIASAAVENPRRAPPSQ
jgi:hypothetical protein